MPKFASWKDYNLLLKNWAYCSCLNCVGYNGDLDKGTFVCMRAISPIRLDMLVSCVDWMNEDTETLDDYPNHNEWKFPDIVADEIDAWAGAEINYEQIMDIIRKHMSEDEIREVLGDEEVKE